MCSIENLFFQYNASKFPFHNPLVMKYYNLFLAYLSLDYENCPFTKFSYFVHKLYIFNTHMLHGPRIYVLYAWVNSYSILCIILHQGNILPSR